MKIKKNIITSIMVLQCGFIFAQNTFPGSGSVGIGTLNPLSALDVNGDITLSNSGLPMGLITEVHGFSPLLNVSLNFRESNVNQNYLGAAFRIDARSPGIALFQWLKRDPGIGIGEKVIMSLTQSGNLGLGVDQAGECLAVNGNIRAKEVKVEAANWPDYVFNSTYKLSPLKATEAYIATNGHLPEIRSAMQAETKGISLGE